MQEETGQAACSSLRGHRLAFMLVIMRRFISLASLARWPLQECMLSEHLAQAARGSAAMLANMHQSQGWAIERCLSQHQVPACLLAVPASQPQATLTYGMSQGLDAGFCGTLGMLIAGLIASTTTARADSVPQASPSTSIPVSETAVHPLDYEPVTNEHTANMTLARNAALEYYQAGKYAQAEAKFHEALAEAKLGFDEKDPHIASAMNNVAEFYRNTGQHDKAEKLYLEAMSSLERIYGERHWLYVSAMHNLALSYEEQGNLDAAETTMERVMNLRLIMFGARHFLYADSMYALGHILMKQAAKLKSAQQNAATGEHQQHSSSSREGVGGGWWSWWGQGGGSGDGVRSAEELERRAVNLMEDAVKVLEDAESVQANVVVAWLTELSEHYSQHGQLNDAVRCMRKALHHFTNDKGELHANASQLSDALIELLLRAGQVREARDVAAACAAARQQLFGRELVVAQAWLRLAILDAQTSQGALADAQQHAHNAATLSGEILAQYSKPRVTGWLGRQGQDQSLKRARAAHLYASSLKFTAEHASTASSAVSKMHQAVQALEAATAATAKQLNSPGKGASGLDELADLYVELQLQLVECLDLLARGLNDVVAAGGTDAAAAGSQLQAVKGRLQLVSQELLSAAQGQVS